MPVALTNDAGGLSAQRLLCTVSSGGWCLSIHAACGHPVVGSAAVGGHWSLHHFHRRTSQTDQSSFYSIDIFHSAVFSSGSKENLISAA